jgi:predicted O-linked N-acetylglucosamine transferase (SPINDLY family)
VLGDRGAFVETTSFENYLAHYGQIDIALDPFPYCGGTTTCDALYMGVPVITLAGKTAVGRGGVSILNQVGLQELIATSPEQYAQIAASLAGDTAKLAKLRRELRGRMTSSPLCDAAAFTRDFEAKLRWMWQNATLIDAPR